MTPYEMGRISAFLTKHRKIEDRADKRGAQRDEKDLALVLREASIENMRDLEELMSGQGFTLVTLNSFDIPGIGQGSRVHLLVRRTDSTCPLLDFNKIVERMAPPNGRAITAKIWFTQIWLAHLDILYTQRDRSPKESHQWIEAAFTREILEDAVRDHINSHVRRINPNELEISEVYEVLSAEKGTDISRYTKRFLDLMCDSGLLETLQEDVYRQSLLAAIEMKENFDRTLAPLMIDDEADGPGTVKRTTLASAAVELLTQKTTDDEGANQ